MTTGKMQESMKITSNYKDEWWLDTLNVHLNGTFYCTREALKIMEEKGGGKIINMASYCGISGCPGLAAYSAAKGGIMAFSKSLAKEVIGSGINVNVVGGSRILRNADSVRHRQAVIAGHCGRKAHRSSGHVQRNREPCGLSGYGRRRLHRGTSHQPQRGNVDLVAI